MILDMDALKADLDANRAFPYKRELRILISENEHLHAELEQWRARKVYVEVSPGGDWDRLGVLATEALEVAEDGWVNVYVPKSMVLAWARNIEREGRVG